MKTEAEKQVSSRQRKYQVKPLESRRAGFSYWSFFGHRPNFLINGRKNKGRLVNTITASFNTVCDK